MENKRLLKSWIAASKEVDVLTILLQQQPDNQEVIMTSGRYHTYVQEKRLGIQSPSFLATELAQIRYALTQLIDTLEIQPIHSPIQNPRMTPTELYQNLLLGAAGNATYDGLKKYLTAWKTILVPTAKNKDDLMEKINMMLVAAEQNIEAQTFMIQMLNELYQKTIQPKPKPASSGGTTIIVENGGKIGAVISGDGSTNTFSQTF